MGRLEAFAMANKPWPSFLDGIGNGAGYGFLLILVAFCVFATIAAFFARRSLKELATHSGIKRFTTIGLLLLIGAILSIVLIGVLLVWISALILAITFFTMKTPNTTIETTTVSTTTA
jgi:uncharacterized membrane protein